MVREKDETMNIDYRNRIVVADENCEHVIYGGTTAEFRKQFGVEVGRDLDDRHYPKGAGRRAHNAVELRPARYFFSEALGKENIDDDRVG